MSEENTQDFEKLQEKFGRFRILIVGRANAGKTTILRGICNSTENPEIYDGDGNKVDPSKVEGSRGRGIHNVENELIFRSNEKLVFHDSQGFEAGREDEFLQTKKFIADRANTTILKKRIHAIWYCIPMDKLDRAIQRSEEMFFDECDPGNVPVVVLFTKFDALLAVALGKLAPADKELPLQDRLSKAKLLIEGIFERADAWGRLSQMQHAPRFCVKIGGMHKSNEACSNLLEATTTVLNEKALQMLLISAQEVNVALCVRYAVRELIRDIERVHNQAVPVASISKLELQRLAWWFPHTGRGLELEEQLDLVTINQAYVPTSEVLALKPQPHGLVPFSTWKEIFQAGVDIILISQYSFFLHQQNIPEPFSSAAQRYKASETHDRVEKTLKEVFKQFGKASFGEKVDLITNVILQNHRALTTEERK